MTPRLREQPAAAWAILTAFVVASMGIGLVDPILPIIAQGLHATNSQVELLFTSYFAIIGVSMLGTGWLSSRLGVKNTMLLGLSLVVVCAAAAGAANSVVLVVAFRAGWGLGIALFISTCMTALIGVTRGGVAVAVVLFESALAAGIASGPLVGGILGGIGWRYPFFGVSLLMIFAFLSILRGMDRTPPPPREQRIALSAPLRALGDRHVLLGALVALLYNFGFFVLLAYTPLPLGLGVHELGLVFFAWGLLVAFGAIIVAPALMARRAIVPTLTAALCVLSADLAIIGLAVHDRGVMIAGIIGCGVVLGVANALLSNLLIGLTTGNPSVASSATNFMRFGGGAIAPFLSGKLSEHVSIASPLYVGAGVVLAGVGIMVVFRPLLARGERPAIGADAPVAADPLEVPLAGSSASR